MCPEGKDTPPSAAYILSIFNIEQIEKSRTKVTARHAHIVAGVFFKSSHGHIVLQKGFANLESTLGRI